MDLEDQQLAFCLLMSLTVALIALVAPDDCAYDTDCCDAYDNHEDRTPLARLTSRLMQQLRRMLGLSECIISDSQYCIRAIQDCSHTLEVGAQGRQVRPSRIRGLHS
jgi:hypothetical protein